MKPELLNSIRKKAEKNRTEIRDKALKEAEEISEKANGISRDMLNKAHLRIQGEADRLLERKYNIIRFQTNARRYELKSSAIESIWQEIDEILGKIEHSDGYKTILENLFYECLSSAPDNSLVKASPQDADTVKSCIRRSKQKLLFEEDPRVHGGVEFHWPDGKVVLINTLSHRLSRLKAEGNSELSRILFSSGEGSTA
ncbi:V-type ATP synthase subunit E [Candidatus Latescibacterota bacterium]